MVLSDAEIAAMLAEQKPEVDARALLHAFANRSPKSGHRRHAVPVDGAAGTRFQLSLRQSTLDPYDFSVILSVVRREGTLNLRRHNGTRTRTSTPSKPGSVLELERLCACWKWPDATPR